MSAHMRGDRFKLLLRKILFISISFERDEFNESFWFCSAVAAKKNSRELQACHECVSIKYVISVS